MKEPKYIFKHLNVSNSMFNNIGNTVLSTHETTIYNDSSLDELLEHFKGFLCSCGFPIDSDKTLEFVEEFPTNETIEDDWNLVTPINMPSESIDLKDWGIAYQSIEVLVSDGKKIYIGYATREEDSGHINWYQQGRDAYRLEGIIKWKYLPNI
jgi:hypothetical protein